MTQPRIREEPEDFIVEELATIDPVEDGDHVLLQVQAIDVDHHTMVERLAAVHGVHRRNVGWAGMKDRRAVSRQWITIKTDAPAVLLDDPDLKVEQALRCARRRRPGQLMGNKFEIAIRGVEPTALLAIMPRLRTIAEEGLPNRFGPQRFGHRGINPLLGRALLQGDLELLFRIWLGQEGPPFDEREIDRRRAFEQGRWDEAHRGWPPRWAPERTAIEALARTGSVERALATVPRRIRGLWVDALQSVVFNEVLNHRLKQGTLLSLADDDVASVFTNFQELVGDSQGPARSPTGPLFGRKMRRPGASIAALEYEVLKAQGLQLELFTEGPDAPGGARRPLVVPVLRASAEAGVDDRGGYLRLRFCLPRGAYATSVLSVLGFEDVR